jgi:peroxiredoxin (alkyl hydroperoxide reductase subunit C)
MARMSTTPTRIKVGDPLPQASLKMVTPEGAKPATTQELFGKGKHVLFGVPGAFTGTCSNVHLPGFVKSAAEFKAKGVGQVACLAVNDAAVMDAWSKAQGAGGKVTMLADGNADFVKAMGLNLDLSSVGMGMRSQRFAMVVKDGKVAALDVEEKASACDVSGAPKILAKV